VVLKLVSRI